MDAIRDFLDEYCLGTLMPKEMYPNLETFKRIYLLPAVKLFMTKEFMISSSQKSHIADMDFEELAETAIEWWPWEPVFKMWQQEMTSLSALWKTMSRKSGVSVDSSKDDVDAKEEEAVHWGPEVLDPEVFRVAKLATPADADSGISTTLLAGGGSAERRPAVRPAILRLSTSESGPAEFCAPATTSCTCTTAATTVSTADSSTLTDLCTSENLPEVEFITLIGDTIPRYKLRADTLTSFSGYENQDWLIPSPALPVSVGGDLTPDQTRETLNYFLLCGDRVSQMTKTYNDVEAVTRLLEEKEKDLELAARIGQGLLARNQALEDRLVAVDGELASAHETVTQLRHDLSLKSELLQIYTNDFDDSSPEGVRAFTCDLLQRKVKGLEDDNRKLRAEASQLASDSSECELREEQLLHDVLAQLGEANSHIKNLDDELAKKYDDMAHQKEEITSLLAQLVSQRHKIRELTLENEELVMQLRVVRECQNELATELVDYKDKYAEILELLRETQEQLKQQNKRNLPTARSGFNANHYSSTPSYNSPRLSAFHPDSLASELEMSSLGSDGWMSDFSSCLVPPKQHAYQRIFETVKCASSQLSGPSYASSPCKPSPNHPVRKEVRAVALETCSTVQPTPAALPDLPQVPVSGADAHSPDETDYPSSSRIGVPGTPGTVDLTNALRRLSPRDRMKSEGGNSNEDGYGWRTPDSIMSTGSRSAFTSLSLQYPEKLKIIKPIEGSTTLHHWSRLATPHLGTLLEDRPGVATRETDHEAAVKYSRDLLEMYSLLDVEEDEDMIQLPGKSFDSAATIYTFTNSTILHPDELTRVTSSLQGTCLSTGLNPTCSADSSTETIVDSGLSACNRSRRNSTTTFSTQLALAKALQERGTSNVWAIERFLSGVSTPNNSPDCTPPDSPTISYGPIELLQKGAKIIRRTLTGVETPNYVLQPVPRIPKHELQELSNLNLLDKLEKLGLNQVAPRDAPVSPEALQLALEQLSWSRTEFDTDDVEEPASAKKTGDACQTTDSNAVNIGLNVIAQINSPTCADKVTTSLGSVETRAKFQNFFNDSPRKHLGGQADVNTKVELRH